MTFISYAQNAEDVILWRALKHIDNGFYIDVGANDPEDDSVTKAFYDRGWHGINIEPLPQHHACLQKQRPRDINLQIAAGDHNGELILYDVPSVRGWATSDPDVADHYRQQGLEVISTSVPVSRLDSLCAEFAVNDIHFLKIDVEGFEAQVIQGMNFQQWRPWILIIEATRPNTQDSQHHLWEPMLLDNQYQYAYSDGLNRYYVAQEHLALTAALALQPNVFDNYRFIGYQRAELALQSTLKQLENLQIEIEHSRQQQHLQQHALQQAEIRIAQLENRSTQAEARAMQAEARAMHAEAQAAEAQKGIKELLSSSSWRITAPLRNVKNMYLRFNSAIREDRIYSGLKRRISSRRHRSRQPAAPLPPKEQSQSNLSPRAARIYSGLKKAIEARKD